jgi:hypothetical protein
MTGIAGTIVWTSPGALLRAGPVAMDVCLAMASLKRVCWPWAEAKPLVDGVNGGETTEEEALKQYALLANNAMPLADGLLLFIRGKIHTLLVIIAVLVPYFGNARPCLAMPPQTAGITTEPCPLLWGCV